MVIAGGVSDSGDYAEKLKELAARDERVIFTGFVQGQALAELCSNAYVYVQPSDVEGMPLTLLLIKPDEDIFGPAEHNGTFRGNQLSFVAGNAGLEFMLDNNLEAETRRKAKIIEDFIVQEILPLDSRLYHRGIGFMWGIECDNLGGDHFSHAVTKACFDRKLIIERAGRDSSVVKIMPPLVIEDELLLEGLKIVKDAFIQALAENK